MKVELLKGWLGHKPGKVMHMADGVANVLIKRKMARLVEDVIETADARPVMERRRSRGK
jgi:hypothetical protein